MLKRRSKHFALLLVLTMLATMFVGVGTASAAGNIISLTTPAVADGDAKTLGTIKVTVIAGTITNGDTVTMKLPTNYKFGKTVLPAGFNTTPQTAVGSDNHVYVPNLRNGADPNGLVATNITISILNASNEIQLTSNADQSLVDDFVFWVYLRDINVASAASGDCIVTFDGPSSSGFPMGTVVVGKAAAAGKVTLDTSGLVTGNNTFTFNLRIKEEVAGSLEVGDKTIRVKLPDGYKFTTPTITNATLSKLWGENMNYSLAYNNTNQTEAQIEFVGFDANDNGSFDVGETNPTTEASAWDLPLAFDVNDDSKAKSGAIEAYIYGKSNLSPGTLKIGTYGEFGATIETETTIPEIYAGMTEQKIAKIIIKEDLKASLLEDRSVLLELPAQARWQEEQDAGTPTESTTDNGLQLQQSGFTGTDNRTAKYLVNVAGAATVTSDKAEVEFKNMEVVVQPGFTGDLTVKVSGSAGLSKELVVAKVISPVTCSASNKPSVIIGKKAQEAGDFEIKEIKAGAITDDGAILLNLSDGVTWGSLPTIAVTEGNIRLGTPTFATNVVTIPVDSTSSVASTIKVSNAKVTVDRTVPEGDITVRVRGLGVINNTLFANVWANSLNAASSVLATVGTPAPGDLTSDASFVIGSTTYKLNGVDTIMDVAPYIKDSRTYMPIRYVAYALGINDANILWDGAKQTVTLMKGDKVVQLQVGSATLLINGAAVTMDVAPEITSDRTMLPIRFVANAFGADADWDAATQTVTIK